MIFTQHRSLGLLPLMVCGGFILGMIVWLLVSIHLVVSFAPVILIPGVEAQVALRPAEVNDEYVTEFSKRFVDYYYNWWSYNRRYRMGLAFTMMYPGIASAIQARDAEEFALAEAVNQSSSAIIHSIGIKKAGDGRFQALLIIDRYRNYGGLVGRTGHEYLGLVLNLDEVVPSDGQPRSVVVASMGYFDHDEINRLNVTVGSTTGKERNRGKKLSVEDLAAVKDVFPHMDISQLAGAWAAPEVTPKKKP